MPTALAYESARGNMHGVLALYHRRGIEMEGYACAGDAVLVRRGSINREIGRLDSVLVDRVRQVDNELDRRSARNQAAAGRDGGGRYEFDQPDGVAEGGGGLRGEGRGIPGRAGERR